MNIQEILKELDEFCTITKEQLDKDAELWGSLKAKKDHLKELRDIKLAELKLKFEGSDAFQTTQAKAHQDWKEFIEKQENELADFYTVDYKKGYRESMVDVLRSLLSFNKNRVEHEI